MRQIAKVQFRNYINLVLVSNLHSRPLPSYVALLQVPTKMIAPYKSQGHNLIAKLHCCDLAHVHFDTLNPMCDRTRSKPMRSHQIDHLY